MLELTSAFALFLALHSVPTLPGIRTRIVKTVGHRTYLALYSLASVLALAWMFKAALATEYIELWQPAAWQIYVTLAAAPLGIFLVCAGLLSHNPFSISMRPPGKEPGAIVSVTRHPVLWGFILWALGHLIPNGDLRSVILFGGLAAFSAGGFFLLETRARKRLGGEWDAARKSSSIMPLGAVIMGRAKLGIDPPLIYALILTAVIVGWLVLAGGHATLFAADPLALVL